MTEQTKELNWRQVPFNKTLQKLQPSMISDEQGFVVLKKFTRQDIGYCNVTYDRDYVKFWLIRNFFSALMISSYNDAQTIFAEAWREFKQNKEESPKS